jgi:transcriptional regulator with XRE-family HTH domain
MSAEDRDRAPSPFSRDIAAALSGYIKQNKVSQQQLAQRVGYSEPYMSKRLTGKAAITTDVIAAAAELTGKTYQQMVAILMSRITDPPDPLNRIVSAGIDAAEEKAAAEKAAAEKRAAEKAAKPTRKRRRG